MRGVVGGMFDPVHFGHYKPALELAPLLGLSEIRLIPCARPAHRPEPAASGAHRLAMLRLIADGRFLIADDRELRRGGVSYTFDTLCSLQEEDDAPLALIVGADALAGLPAWRRADELPGLCHVAAVARPGADGFPALPAAWSARCTREPAELRESPCGRVYLHEGTAWDLSSTRVRALLRAGEQPRHCLPGPVWSYLRRHRLYPRGVAAAEDRS